jgi:hypothetical protein
MVRLVGPSLLKAAWFENQIPPTPLSALLPMRISFICHQALFSSNH